MKKILYLNHVSELGGGEYCLLNLMLNLDRDKYEPILLLQEPGPLSKLAEKNNIPTYFIRMRGWRKLKFIPINHMLTLKEIKKLIKKLKIDLLHCNAYRLNPYGLAAARAFHVPCVTNIKWFTRKDHIQKFKLDKTDLLITVSDYIASFFTGSSARVQTIYDGVEVSEFSRKIDQRENKIRKEFNIESKIFLVGMVAQITPRKGHKDFIKAAALVKKTLPEVKFLVVGGAILDTQLSLESLMQYAREVEADNVIFTGQRKDRVDIFQALNCFVLPSHIEPFAGVIMEAMAASVPVIATQSGGAVEIIRDYENGLLVPVKSPEAIAEKIIELVKDPNMVERFREKGFQTVNDNFKVHNCVKKVEMAYEALLNEKRNN